MNLQDLIDMENDKKPVATEVETQSPKAVKKSTKKDAKFEQTSLLVNSKSEAEGFSNVEAEGYFKDEGLDIDLVLTPGADKTAAAGTPDWYSV